jgi:hypothetical protein
MALSITCAASFPSNPSQVHFTSEVQNGRGKTRVYLGLVEQNAPALVNGQYFSQE